jgi:DNA repair ATPase RecN
MNRRDEFFGRLKKRIDEWNHEIEGLEQRVDTLKSDLKTRYQGRLDELKAKRGDAEAKLEELRASGEDAWEKVQKEAEHAWLAFKEAVSTFKAHYKKDTDKSGEDDGV